MTKKKLFLEDPTSVRIYEVTIKGVTRRVVMIGEVHEIIECPQSRHRISIADFIRAYHKKIGLDKTLDIFSETFYVANKKIGWIPSLLKNLYRFSTYNENRALFYLRKRLDACCPKYNFSLYKCPEKTRFHLCDVRYMERTNYSIKKKSRMECAVDKFFKIAISYDYQYIIPLSGYALQDLVSFTKSFLFDTRSPHYHLKLKDYILRRTKSDKQLQNIPSKKIRDKVMIWYETQYAHSILYAQANHHFFEKRHDVYKGVAYVPRSCRKDFVSNISLPMIYIASVFMDLYLMSRLLRNFSDGTVAENAIVYVGQFHANNYDKLMNSIGAKKLVDSHSIDRTGYVSCVDVSGIL